MYKNDLYKIRAGNLCVYANYIEENINGRSPSQKIFNNIHKILDIQNDICVCCDDEYCKLLNIKTNRLIRF